MEYIFDLMILIENLDFTAKREKALKCFERKEGKTVKRKVEKLVDDFNCPITPVKVKRRKKYVIYDNSADEDLANLAKN